VITAFNSIYQALRGFFSQGFWFATFLPVALFAALHLAIAIAVLGSASLLGMTVSFREVKGDSTTASTLIIVAVIVIAYALQPLVPHFRSLLDGSQLPGWMHQWLRPQRLARAREMRRNLKQALDDMGAMVELYENVHAFGGALRTAYRAAQQHPGGGNEAAADTARRALRTLQDALSQPPALAPLAQAAQQAVIDALRANNPDPDALATARGAAFAVSPLDRRIAEVTNQIADDLEEHINETTREAIYRHQVLRDRNRLVGALDAPRATQIGDARFVAESYAKSVYGVNFDFLWPRLLVAMRDQKSDDPMLSTIDAARAQVDFAVLSMFLTVTVPVVWGPIILARGGPAWLFLAIGAVTPLALSFFYELAFEVQLAFGDIAQTAIDRSRFLVLRMLRQSDPPSRGEERRLWVRIASADADGRSTELLYVAAPASAATMTTATTGGDR
jgi:hypothetical protein